MAMPLSLQSLLDQGQRDSGGLRGSSLLPWLQSLSPLPQMSPSSPLTQCMVSPEAHDGWSLSLGLPSSLPSDGLCHTYYDSSLHAAHTWAQGPGHSPSRGQWPYPRPHCRQENCCNKAKLYPGQLAAH